MLFAFFIYSYGCSGRLQNCERFKFCTNIIQLLIFSFYPLSENLYGMHIIPHKTLIYIIIKCLKNKWKDLILKLNFLYQVLFYVCLFVFVCLFVCLSVSINIYNTEINIDDH